MNRNMGVKGRRCPGVVRELYPHCNVIGVADPGSPGFRVKVVRRGAYCVTNIDDLASLLICCYTSIVRNTFAAELREILSH